MKVSNAPQIRKLDELVVNRIAAGEVVQRPSAAIKEMMENSLDAGSTSIVITVKGGGMQLLQIQDNGHGIRKDDLGIVCERFTTSKLSTFEDLKKINTYGFRGEALASITHVAHVTILTRTADSQCAYKSKYLDGKPVPMKPGENANPKPCAGVVGTTITVEDLFYNLPTRKQAFKNPNEQYQRILDVVTKHAIHFGSKKVSFTCKKHGQTTPDLHTPNNSDTLENIRIAYGTAVARELIDFELTSDSIANGNANVHSNNDSSYTDNNDFEGILSSSSSITSTATPEISFTLKGKLSNANYNNKKGIFIFFINERLVESAAIRKVIEAVYTDLLPRHTHPFVYLSLTLPSHHVDINVHPTKKEVHFLFETEIMHHLYTSLTQKLRSANESRTFYTQTISFNNSQMGLKIVKNDNDVDKENDDVLLDSDDDVVLLETNKSKRTDIDNDGNDNDNDYDNEINDYDNIGDIDETVDDRNVNINDDIAPLSKSSRPKIQQKINADANDNSTNTKKRPSSSSNNTIAYKLIRTDPTLTKINAFFQPIDTYSNGSANTDTSGDTSTNDANEHMKIKNNAVSIVDEINCICEPINSTSSSVVGAFARSCRCCEPNRKSTTNCNVLGTNDVKLRARVTVITETKTNLASIHTLLNEIETNQSKKMLMTMKAIIVVGVVNDRLVVVQHNTNLLLVNYHLLCKDLFYQLTIRRFAVTKPLVLSSHVNIFEMLRAAMDSPEAKWDSNLGLTKEEIATAACATLVERREMLQEYFNIGVTDNGMLTTMPMLLEGYYPASVRLPMFLLRLAVEVDWTDEISCFQGVATELSNYHAYIHLPSSSITPSLEDSSTYSSLEMIENVLLPSLKNHLIPNDNSNNAFTQIGSLEQLYKIFERC